ncbi:MAG TPA: ABC transporter permease [Pseudoxanthomonas sp.]|nr:ABC transporter permease [Pseudoxanthomonas sp.]
MNALAPAPFTKHMAVALYLREAKYEFLRVLRTPAFSIPTLVFAPMFYLLFGVLLNRGNTGAASYLMATYSVFGVIGPGLFGFGVGLAIDRERGLLTLKRVQPVPAMAPLLAKVAMAMIFAVCIGAILLTLGVTLGGVRMTLSQSVLLLCVDVLGVMPFCALGLLIGAWVNGNAAPALVNLIYMPMALLSGLWLPLKMLPGVVEQIAPLWPAWHLGQLALKVVGQDSGHAVGMHVAVLLGFTAICLFLAQRRLQRS